MLAAFSHASRIYLYEGSSKEQIKEDLKSNLNLIRAYFFNKEKIDWDPLTTEMTYDEKLWDKVAELVRERGDQIIKDVLTLHIKFSK